VSSTVNLKHNSNSKAIHWWYWEIKIFKE